MGFEFGTFGDSSTSGNVDTYFLGSGICWFFGYQLPDVVIVFNGEQTLELGTVRYALLTHPTSLNLTHFAYPTLLALKDPLLSNMSIP